jgi:hypothetical protein
MTPSSVNLELPPGSPLARLRKFSGARSAQERCELCGAALSRDHQHLLELKHRQIQCACDGCAILFDSDQTARYRRIPRRSRLLSDLSLSEEVWESLHIPINLAFFHRNSAAGKVVALYPSPAGATESLLPLESWQDLVQLNPQLQKMADDVEALLINRIGPRHEAYLAPIDACFRLVGLIRSNWRGLSGGTEVWREINRFFDELRAVSTPGEHGHA